MKLNIVDDCWYGLAFLAILQLEGAVFDAIGILLFMFIYVKMIPKIDLVNEYD